MSEEWWRARVKRMLCKIANEIMELEIREAYEGHAFDRMSSFFVDVEVNYPDALFSWSPTSAATIVRAAEELFQEEFSRCHDQSLRLRDLVEEAEERERHAKKAHRLHSATRYGKAARTWVFDEHARACLLQELGAQGVLHFDDIGSSFRRRGEYLNSLHALLHVFFSHDPWEFVFPRLRQVARRRVDVSDLRSWQHIAAIRARLPGSPTYADLVELLELPARKKVGSLLWKISRERKRLEREHGLTSAPR